MICFSQQLTEEFQIQQFMARLEYTTSANITRIWSQNVQWVVRKHTL
jgi:hypothetical protein